MSLEWLFAGANLFVLPFWFLAIVLPNWGVTRRILSSPIPFILLAGIYLYSLTQSVDAESAKTLANPQLADIARFFSQEAAAATGWFHFLVMDLFVGRWVYWEGQRTGVWTTHSLILCLFAGPVGLLSHLITAAIADRFFPASKPDLTPESANS